MPNQPFTIEELPPVTIAYLRHTGPYGPGLAVVWEQLHDWAVSSGLQADHRTSYGVSLDNPMVTPPEQCRYDAGLEIDPNLTVQGASKTQLPGGRYLVASFLGTAAEIGPAYARAMGPSLTDAGRVFDPSRPIFERYPGDAGKDKDGKFACDLCVPVK